MEQEISEIWYNAVPQMSVTDEAAVEDELAALQAELDADAVDNSTPQLLPILPVAPTDKLPDIQTPVTENVTATLKPERVAVPG